MLKQYLDDLESRVNPKEEDALIEQWRKFLNNEVATDLFIPRREYVAPPTIEYPRILGNHAINDIDLMVIRELKGCSDLLQNNAGSLLNVRANYGVGIATSIFGAEIFFSEDKLDVMPITRKMTAEQISNAIKKGVPDIDKGLLAKVFEFGNYFNSLIQDYPNIKKYIHHYHPDLQGPLDLVELMWGTEIFTDVLLEPQKVKDFLELVTETYIKVLKKWYEEFPPYYENMSAHWGLMISGHVMLRDDSATNFSPDLVDELVLPYNQKILNEFEGGAIHFCGNGTHMIKSLCSLDKMWGIQLSQPDYNDMETIFKQTVDKNIKLLGLRHDGVEEALNANRALKGQVHTGEFIFNETSTRKS